VSCTTRELERRTNCSRAVPSLYMITSPVVRGESLKFKEEGVRDILKDVFLPWYNALRLLVQSCDQLAIDRNVTFVYDEPRLHASVSSNSNVMDTWIVSYTQTLLDFVKQEMDGEWRAGPADAHSSCRSRLAYRLYTVVPRLIKYIDMLTNWYVKLNKKRLKVSGRNARRVARARRLTPSTACRARQRSTIASFR
jgi:isoleucyl-tRNA synthetase